MGGKFKVTKKRKQSLSPEEKQLRSIRAKRRFKAIVRLALANRYWLEEEEEEKLGDDVRKNVQILTKKKGKKSLINLKEKSILMKAAEDRTEAEKFHLNRIIGGLKCFRRYPPDVKSQLAGVTYFVYFPAGRVLIKQNHPPFSLYFLLTGEVHVSQTNWDPILNEYVTTNVGIMEAGSMFGEVSLLHGIQRTATITTATPCELLCLKKEDFDIVLKASVMEQWDAIINAMSNFTYFNDWDEVARRECCILAKMREFAPGETILGDGFGFPNSAYFVIKGKCKVIEHLMVKVSYKNGKKRYSLYENFEQNVVVSTALQDVAGDAQDTQLSMASMSMSTSASYEKVPANKPPSEKDRSKSPDTVNEDNVAPLFSILPSNVEVHFMQCCFLHETAAFGIGENLKHRRVVAVNDVQCLLIPKYWLMQKNKGNIWNKIAQFLTTHIPSSQKLLKEFLVQKRWDRYKKKLTSDILANRKAPNTNTIHNVPYSIRVQDDFSYKYTGTNKSRIRLYSGLNKR